jgi:hypothetical protein
MRPKLTEEQQLYIKLATVTTALAPSSSVLTIWLRDVLDHEAPCKSHFEGNGENLPKGVHMFSSDHALNQVRNACCIGRVRQVPDF